MTGEIALQQHARWTRLDLAHPRTVLAALLLVLLSGLPQIGLGLTGLDFGGERITGAVPVTRSVLIDKLLPEVASLAPPDVSDFPPALTTPPPLLFLLVERRAWAAEEPEPIPWLFDLTSRLYRHNSSYV